MKAEQKQRLLDWLSIFLLLAVCLLLCNLFPQVDPS